MNAQTSFFAVALIASAFAQQDARAHGFAPWTTPGDRRAPSADAFDATVSVTGGFAPWTRTLTVPAQYAGPAGSVRVSIGMVGFGPWQVPDA
ncbi:MAG: hypothetical protein AB7O21_16515 [Gammaproteobacteria bacterium]